MGPTNLDWNYFLQNWPHVRQESFQNSFFENKESYSNWMLRPDLYARFADFTYLLICQTDALIVRPLEPSSWTFDYLGAPWSPPYKVGWNPITKKVTTSSLTFGRKTISVGNGGLSIRKTSAFQRFTRGINTERLGYTNEDIYISYFGPREGLVLAEEQVAAVTFMETGARSWTVGQIPPNVCGFHGLEIYNPALEAHLLAKSGPSGVP